jgi:hypothetical protein
MKLYLDDNHAGTLLVALLTKAGHSVIRPADVNLVGVSDARHLRFAILKGHLMLSADRQDFWDLNDLVLTSGGHHPGILLVRFDNDPRRDMKPKHIVTAIGKLERSGISIGDQVIILNQWR